MLGVLVRVVDVRLVVLVRVRPPNIASAGPDDSERRCELAVVAVGERLLMTLHYIAR